MSEQEIFDLLNQKADLYNQKSFIDLDPIQIPHRFTIKQDIEIAGFFAASIAWGNRKAIIQNAEKIMFMMDDSPFDFIKNFTDADLKHFPDKAVHRTFNMDDLKFFLKQFQRIYRQHNSLEDLFLVNSDENNFYHAIERFRTVFLDTDHRAHKHVSSPYKNSASKRIMMYLRWMVRNDNRGVDFGIWNTISPKHLSIPLDVHTANISRTLGLLQRKQNDWKAVEELDIILRKYNVDDPAIYDYALFGIGINKDLA